MPYLNRCEHPVNVISNLLISCLLKIFCTSKSKIPSPLSKRKFLDLIFFFIQKILFAIDVSAPVLTISRLRFLKELLFSKYFSIK